MGEKLTAETLTGLRWARRCNDKYGVGYLGPTVMRLGPLPEYQPACEAGLLECRLAGNSTGQLGYFITHAGRQALTTEGDHHG